MDRIPAYVEDMLPAARELTSLAADAPLARFLADRLRLAHRYAEIDHEVPYQTSRNDLPAVAAALERWLSLQALPPGQQ